MFVMNIDGSQQTQLTHVSANILYYSWSHDGKYIAYVTEQQDRTQNIYIANTDGSNERLLITGLGCVKFPAWSPNGEHIACSACQDNELRLFVVDVADGSFISLNIAPVNSAWYPWSPDGQYLLFTTKEDGNEEIYMARADNSEFIRLTETSSENEYDLAWLSTGQEIAFWASANNLGRNNLYTMSIDTREQTLVYSIP